MPQAPTAPQAPPTFGLSSEEMRQTAQQLKELLALPSTIMATAETLETLIGDSPLSHLETIGLDRIFPRLWKICQELKAWQSELEDIRSGSYVRFNRGQEGAPRESTQEDQASKNGRCQECNNYRSPGGGCTYCASRKMESRQEKKMQKCDECGGKGIINKESLTGRAIWSCHKCFGRGSVESQLKADPALDEI